MQPIIHTNNYSKVGISKDTAATTNALAKVSATTKSLTDFNAVHQDSWVWFVGCTYSSIPQSIATKSINSIVWKQANTFPHLVL